MRRPSPAFLPNEARPSTREKIVILGGGPNRIGQGIEFDYCCCHASFALRAAGYETIMINCNPETVSTDYDTSDRLYFEPLTAEDVLEILATRALGRTAARRHRAVRRPDAAEARRGLAAGGNSDPRHQRRFDRSRRGPRPLQAPARQARPQTADERHRLFGRAVAPRRRRSRPAARRAAVLCARRPRHGDHPRCVDLRRLSARDAARASCPRTSRRAIPTTRPARSTPCSARIRCSSIAICRMRSRSMSMRSATARTSSSAASWNISKRRASIPATAPARCRRARLRRR